MKKYPTNTQIANLRNTARITQTEAASIVQCSLRTWQSWESGTAKMRAGLWELFKSKVMK